MGEAIQQSRLRDVNMKQLGAGGPQRVEAVATWLQARAGTEGKATADRAAQEDNAGRITAKECSIGMQKARARSSSACDSSCRLGA
jgi:hypothetical protein